ncbi:hypothetical protein C0992_012398 [Termitomyces sp. T32_za158]|nr:hypothetical protein C0992_012398 [Termitomyces sp. T32_za158]
MIHNFSILDIDDDPSIRWYCVTQGRAVGVFAHWVTVAPMVVGVRGACYSRFASCTQALTAFARARAAGAIRRVD